MKRLLMRVALLVALAGVVVLTAALFYWLAGLGGAAAVRLGVPGPWGTAVVNTFTLGLGIVMTLGAVLTVAERKWSAMIQDRIGPNRIRLFGSSLGGVPFLLADAVKMLTKENTEPADRARVLFDLAPVLALAAALALVAVIPFGPEVLVRGRPVALQIAHLDVGLIYLFAMASLAVYGTTLAGWASNNKLALLGGVRASSQMISYEVSLGMALVGSMIAFGSLQLDAMTRAQGETMLWGAVPALGIILQPLGLIVFFVSAFAETKRAPFDLPEGESEIVGYFVEYSGMKFGMLFLSEFVEIVVLSAVVTAVFLGGWHPVFFEEAIHRALGDGIWWGAVAAGCFLVKLVFLCWLQLAIRWTLPRFRFDQIQRLCWKGLLPVALANVFLTGALVLLDRSRRLLAIVGLVEIALLFFLTVAATRAPSPERPEARAAAGH